MCVTRIDLDFHSMMDTDMPKLASRFAVPAVACLLALATAAPVLAGGKAYPPVNDPVVAKECGACHMRYSAGLLPAASWHRMMAGLTDHFGENAGLDPATTELVRAYLVANAEPEPKNARAAKATSVAAEPLLRITEQRWFKGQHGPRRMSPEALKRKNARSAADCVACHREAELGLFDE